MLVDRNVRWIILNRMLLNITWRTTFSIVDSFHNALGTGSPGPHLRSEVIQVLPALSSLPAAPSAAAVNVLWPTVYGTPKPEEWVAPAHSGN